VIFINVFGGITKADEVAKGALAFYENHSPTCSKSEVKIVMHLVGNGKTEAKAILKEANNPNITIADSQEEAAKIAIELV
jgi:succinyl-CoA synthetase beta subunit